MGKILKTKRRTHTCRVSSWMVEVAYTDSGDVLKDLMYANLEGFADAPPRSEKLEPKRDPRKMIFVSGATTLEAASPQELASHYTTAIDARVATGDPLEMSHILYTIVIDMQDTTTNTTTYGKLTIIDLAGSEILLTADASPRAQRITRSLVSLNEAMCLGTARRDATSVVKRSKLTQLLSDTFAKGSNAVLIS